jgi:hypothetical protein
MACAIGIASAKEIASLLGLPGRVCRRESKGHRGSFRPQRSNAPDVQPREETVIRVPAAALIAANLSVVVLALSEKWGYYSVILVYWIEAMIIGAYGLGRMCVACWFGDPLGKWTGMNGGASRVMLSLFLGGLFVVKFGGFALGMGLLVALTPGLLAGGRGTRGLTAIADGLHEVGTGVLLAAAMLFVSHGVSFALNFIGKREYQHSNVLALLFRPYLRRLLVRLVLAGGFAAAAVMPELYEIPGFAIGVLLIKLLADVASHRIEHRHRTSLAASTSGG